MDSNPYEPIACVDDTRFQLRASFSMAIRFAAVGLGTGLASGYQLEDAVQRPSSSAVLMGGPGLFFGIGLVAAVALFVPAVRRAKRLSKRRLRLVGLPVLALLGFVIIGYGYDYVSRTGPMPRTRSEYLLLWFRQAGVSFPGAIVIGIGCRLIARPRSYVRFFLFLLATAMLAGGAPLITVTNAWGFLDRPFLVTMLVAQLTMFTMLGWIFGDSLEEPGDSATFAEHGSPPQTKKTA